MAIVNISVEDLPVDRQKAIRDRQRQSIVDQLRDRGVSAQKRKKLKAELKNLGV